MKPEKIILDHNTIWSTLDDDLNWIEDLGTGRAPIFHAFVKQRHGQNFSGLKIATLMDMFANAHTHVYTHSHLIRANF